MRNYIGVDHQTALCGFYFIPLDERHRAALSGTVSVVQVGRVGVEPTKSFLRRILSPLRLPIPPPPPTNIVIAAWITSSRGGAVYPPVIVSEVCRLSRGDLDHRVDGPQEICHHEEPGAEPPGSKQKGTTYPEAQPKRLSLGSPSGLSYEPGHSWSGGGSRRV